MFFDHIRKNLKSKKLEKSEKMKLLFFTIFAVFGRPDTNTLEYSFNPCGYPPCWDGVEPDAACEAECIRACDGNPDCPCYTKCISSKGCCYIV